jgi:hypothetical protein
MTRSLRLPAPATILAALALCFSLGGGAYAASPILSPGGSLRLCVAQNGKLHVRTPGQPCVNHEQLIAVNVQGPAGKQGPIGQTGPKGDAGPPGPGAMTFRFDSSQANTATFTDGPLSLTANCNSTSQEIFFLQLMTAKQTNVYTEGVYAKDAGTPIPNLNSILVIPNSPTTIIGDGASGTQQHDSTLLIDQGTASWFVNANVQVDNNTHRCQMVMVLVPST